MNYTDALLPYLLGSQPLPQRPWPQPHLPSGFTFAQMAGAPVEDRRGETPSFAQLDPSVKDKLLVALGQPPLRSMAADLGMPALDRREADLVNARAQQQSPMARALGINDITRLTPQSFATTDDGNVYFNYGR